MYVIELDISHETSTQEVMDFAKEMDCSAKMLIEFGPAGGNPLYQFSSNTLESLRNLINNVYGAPMDEDFVKTIIREI